MALNGDKTCHFAFFQYEKGKTQQELISHQLTLPHFGKFIQFYDVMFLYNFIKKTFWAAEMQLSYCATETSFFVYFHFSTSVYQGGH